MANRVGVLKRIREASRREHQQRKAAKREERRRDSVSRRSDLPSGVDPDIAGIVPGPQPLPFD